MIDFQGIDFDLQPKRLSELIQHDLTLIVSTANTYVEMEYLRYIKQLQDKYNLQVILIDATGDQIFHMVIKQYHPTFITLSDKKQEWLKQLAQMQNITKPIQELSRVWRYQVLVKNGQFVKMWDQPVENQMENFLKNREAVKTFIKAKGVFGLEKFKKMQSNDKSFWEPTTSGGRFEDGEDSYFILKSLYYYNIWPNSDLETKCLSGMARFSISSHQIYRFPCIGVCSIDDNSGYCIGCSRTEEEVYKWEDPNTTDEWKKKNEEELKNR